MQLAPRQFVVQLAHLLQQELFPLCESAVGPMSPQLQLLGAVVALTPLEGLLSARRAATGRPAKDRAALVTAFLAKAILNLPTTRALLSRLRVDQPLRQFCGWDCAKALPHESKFPRAFAEFALGELPQVLHEMVISATQKERLIGHIARDSTAIAARERYPEALRQEKKKARRRGQGKHPQNKHPKGSFAKKKASERGTRIQRQRKQKLAQMLNDLPRQCASGVKKNSQGNEQYWRGYDADEIHARSRQLNHVPLIAPHGRRGTKKPSQLPKIFPPQPTPQLSWAQLDRYRVRTMSERVNARLKDEFGANHLRVRGAAKVMAHLMFGVLALTVDQWLRLSAPG